MDLGHLVKQCQSGDKEALGLFYQTYLTPMRDVVAYYVRNPEAVSDILHDGFIIAFVSISSLKDASKIEAWLTSIMKNLALQHLKEESNHISVPLSDVSVPDDTDNDSLHTLELTWKELDMFLNRLPEGYGKIFRLAVLDGMTHKEIGELLGIAPHSSSSQLARAKAMVRRMITKYKLETGTLSVVAIILFLWHGLSRHQNDAVQDSIISENSNRGPQTVLDTIIDAETKDSVSLKNKIINRSPLRQLQEVIAITVPKDSIPVQKKDSTANDTIVNNIVITHPVELIAKEDMPQPHYRDMRDWSLTLAYTGNPGQNDISRYKIPGSGIPDVESPSGEIEVTEKSHHYMPLVVGVSVNKSLTSRWSIETGLRYTFLRSDFLSESELMNKKTIQRIHYIGIPLKLNYRIFSYNGFSLYGQCGGALDIPVYGTQSIWEKTAETSTLRNDAHIHAPLQWSIEGGLGLQYHFTPSLSIYAEPSFRYYFNAGSDIKTIRQDKPFEFSIPIGLRLTW